MKGRTRTFGPILKPLLDLAFPLRLTAIYGITFALFFDFRGWA
jgi:hypothetical protein